jgi:2-keto-3-deoxy-L-rhamnonate aldolase RhmA
MPTAVLPTIENGGGAIRINTTKAKLSEGKVVFGAIISRYAPALVELFGAIDYDFEMIDCEHSEPMVSCLPGAESLLMKRRQGAQKPVS